MRKKIGGSIVIFVEIIMIFFLLQDVSLRPKIKKDLATFDENLSKTNLPKYYHPDVFITSSNPKLGRELKPNSTSKFDGYTAKLPKISTITINSDGFRDKEYSIKKPSNTFRIIVLGDSVTFGFGVENDEAYPEVLEAKLNSLEMGKNFEVLNFGVWAYGTIQEVEMLKEKGLKYEPDMIILGYHGTDIIDNFCIMEDCYKFVQSVLSRNNISTLFGLPYDLEIKINTEIYKEKEKYIVAQPFEKVWKITEESLKEMANITRAKNIRVMVIGFFTPAPLPSEQHKALKTFCSANGWYFLLAPNVEGFPGDGHPTPSGHRTIADAIYKFLLENKLV